jgi:hypothetical protein
MVPIPQHLYHYTCSHSWVQLGDRGLLQPASYFAKPGVNVGPQGKLIWFTDQARPFAKSLGLERVNLLCDRTEHRYHVTDTTGIVHWFDYRSKLPEDVVFELEVVEGVSPQNWFVSETPIPVAYNPIRKKSA